MQISPVQFYAIICSFIGSLSIESLAQLKITEIFLWFAFLCWKGPVERLTSSTFKFYARKRGKHACSGPWLAWFAFTGKPWKRGHSTSLSLDLVSSRHLCREMHLTLNLGTSCKKDLFVVFISDFMFDRIMCVLVRIKVRGHLVMSYSSWISLACISGHTRSRWLINYFFLFVNGRGGVCNCKMDN